MRLGRNAHGEVLEPGRVPDCYLGLLLHEADDAGAGSVLIVSPAMLLHPSVGQPDGTLLYVLLTGHPDRAPRELVSLADLTVELRAWLADTWSRVGIDPQAAARSGSGRQRGDVPGVRLGGLSAEEALTLERPAMTYVRAQLGDRLGRQLAQPDPEVAASEQRPPGRRPLPVAADILGCGSVRRGHRLSGHRTASPGARSSESTADTTAVSVGCGSVSAVDTWRPDTWLHPDSAWPQWTPHAAVAGFHCRSRPSLGGRVGRRRGGDPARRRLPQHAPQSPGAAWRGGRGGAGRPRPSGAAPGRLISRVAPRGRRQTGRVAWCPTPSRGGRLVSELGPNAFGEPVEPGRVDCYLALTLLLEDEGEEGLGGVLVVAPRWLLHSAVPQPAGSLVYQLATGHPERQAGELSSPPT
jgi:hypothetical protein